MAKEYKFKPDTPAKDVISALMAFATKLCAEHLAYIDAHIKAGHKTAMEMAEHTPTQQAAALVLRLLGADASPELHKVHISKINDPMMAFQIYVKCAWLTDEEDKLLEEKFKGKLPTAENELATGVVKRAK